MGLYLLPETASARPGFALLPVASAGFNQELDLGENMTLSLSAELDLTGGVGIFVRPDQPISFTGGLASGVPAPISGALAVQLKLQEPGDPIVILGSEDGSRLQVGGVSATGGIRFVGENREVFTEFATSD